MKKTLLLITLLVFSLSFSQVNNKNIQTWTESNNTIITNTNNSQLGGDEVTVWENDFSDQTLPNITIENVGGYGDWIWSTESTQGQWGANAGLIESPSVDNGFMLIDADWFNTYPNNGVEDGAVGENAVNSSFTIGPIDLSSSETNALVLQFYSYYRICCFAAGNGANDMSIYISTDNGVTFEDLNYIEGDIYETNVGTQTLSQIPLGAYSPNVENVYFKFEWIGTHYFWMIDDMSIIQQPAYDLKMLSAWLTMEDPANIEYYAIPESQMPSEMLFGAEVYNYGYNDEIDVVLSGAIDGTALSSSTTYELVEADSTKLIETEFFDISSLSAGTYSFTNTVESNGDDALTNDNSLSREFMITENEYKLDGLYDTFDYLGTGWPFGEDNADGVRFANYFDIKETATLSSARIGLYLNSFDTSLGSFETTSGGEVIFYLCDTTGILDPAVESLDMDLGGVLWESDYIMIQEWMVDEGFVSVEIPEIELNPNAYFLVAELYSNGLNNDIIIYDDTSVPQPWYASMYWSPGDETWYSNGNALAIHMGINGLNYANINEENKLNGIELYPNPTNDLINISSNELLNGKTIISVYNILGEIIKTWDFNNFGINKTISIDNLDTGNYILEISNNEKLYHEKIVKK